MTPVSLLAIITLSSTRPPPALACASDPATACKSTTPSLLAGSAITLAPDVRAGASTESCSIAETQMAFQPPAITQLLASLAPLVNTTSLGLAPTSAATCSRAVSIMARARRPSACTDDGLPIDIERGKHCRARHRPQRR